MDKAYDINLDWKENLERTIGMEEIDLPERVPDRFTFLGLPLNSLFGIPACPLTANSKLIKYHSRLGFDVLTYKSVRSIKWSGNRYPHWRYVDAPNGIDLRSSSQALTTSETALPDQEPSMVNSFGIHSAAPPTWQEDYKNATEVLLPGQVLILSLMFTPIDGRTAIDDAKELARLASATPAEIVEINFSHPNTAGGKMLIYEDIELTEQICKEMKTILGTKHLLTKIGYFKNQELLREFMNRTKAVISGISSMNTFMYKVNSADGQETFPGRPSAGVSGAVIRHMAMEQARNIVQFKREIGLNNFVVIGIGGVTQPRHIQAYLDLGVDAVQSAVGAYVDPFLAQKYLQTL